MRSDSGDDRRREEGKSCEGYAGKSTETSNSQDPKHTVGDEMRGGRAETEKGQPLKAKRAHRKPARK